MYQSQNNKTVAKIKSIPGEKYNYAISLGHFCSMAGNLQYWGLRSFSSPFDYIQSPDFKCVIETISNRFEDFINPEYLKICDRAPYIFTNIKTGFYFLHDWAKETAFDDQLPNIIKKYNRRIDRFLTKITEPTLFFRYLSSQSDYDYAEQNLDYISSVLKDYNPKNHILFIGNDEIIENHYHLKLYKVQKDVDFHSARYPFKKNMELMELMNAGIISEEDRLQNILYYSQLENIASIANKKIVLFGSGSRGQYIYDQLAYFNIIPAYFVDNNPDIQNRLAGDTNLLTHNPEALLAEDKACLKIIITPEEPYYVIKAQLIKMGFEECL